MIVICLSPAIALTAEDAASNIDDCSKKEKFSIQGGTVRLENDLFAGTDQNYTNGIVLTLVSHDIPGRPQPKCLPFPIRLHAQLIQYINPQFWADADTSEDMQNVVIRLGQSRYTPEDLTRKDLIVDDRPYAGLLYMGQAWNRRQHKPDSSREKLDTREITLGVIGPWSMAEDAQNLLHKVRGLDRFQGWGNQLKNEPAFEFAISQKYKKFRGNGVIIPGFSSDLIRSAELRLGNIETSATLGVQARMGWSLPNDFGSYALKPGAENRPPPATSLHGKANVKIPVASRPHPGLHFFTILEAKLVGYDYTLDGNFFHDSHSVSRRPWVAHAAVGISAQSRLMGHGVKMAVMRVYRTREFEEQKENQNYGSIAVGMNF